MRMITIVNIMNMRKIQKNGKSIIIIQLYRKFADKYEQFDKLVEEKFKRSV